jgi:predicted amidophosphoribosyltransferase
LLVSRLATKERVDGTGCLVRHKKIPKLATGGNRDQETHFSSIHVDKTDLIKGKSVTLLDDTTTTGNSILACKKMLIDAGARNVQCIALAETKRAE